MNLPLLRSDCSACFGLCCVLLPFSRTGGFGVTKAAGVPCHHLDSGDGCGIHATLREDGWPGCTVFECFGAGQQVSQVTYAGVSWREHDNLGEMSAVLSVMTQLHEMLLYLTEAERRLPRSTEGVLDQVGALTALPSDQLLSLDLAHLHAEIGELLGAVSTRVRSRWQPAADHTRADLAGRDLQGNDLCGATLRGATLIAADLRAVDLSDTDLLGADVRDADVRGAHLATAMFMSQRQVNAMRGDTDTALPDGMPRPRHWS